MQIGALAWVQASLSRTAWPTSGSSVLGVRSGEKQRLNGDAAQDGDHPADTAVWHQRSITVRAVGDRVRVQASGASAKGKAIWVMPDDRRNVQAIHFTDTRVPDRNGTCIRFERGPLRITDCSFLDNENGILARNDTLVELDRAGCEFGRNGAGDGDSHNLSVGRIRRLRLLHDTLVDRRSTGARFIDRHRAPRSARVVFNTLRASAGLRLTESASAAAGDVSGPMATFLAANAADCLLRVPAPAAMDAVPLPAAVDRPVFQLAWPAGHQAAVDPAAWIGALRPSAGQAPGAQR